MTGKQQIAQRNEGRRRGNDFERRIPWLSVRVRRSHGRAVGLGHH